MKRLKNGDKCKNEIQSAKSYRDAMPAIVDELVSSCSRGGCFDHVSAETVPLMPRIMAEYAHGRPRMDIHPGAPIGETL